MLPFHLSDSSYSFKIFFYFEAVADPCRNLEFRGGKRVREGVFTKFSGPLLSVSWGIIALLLRLYFVQRRRVSCRVHKVRRSMSAQQWCLTAPRPQIHTRLCLLNGGETANQSTSRYRMMCIGGSHPWNSHRNENTISCWPCDLVGLSLSWPAIMQVHL